MKSASLCLLAPILFLAYAFSAVAQPGPDFTERLFLEVWSDNSHRSTNFGADEPEFQEEDFVQPAYREEDFFLSQVSLQPGLRTTLADSLFLDARLTFELTGDWGDEAWSDAYWNNMVVWGPGVRLSYEAAIEEEEHQAVWVSDFNLDLFADMLFSEDSPDNGKEAIPDRDARDNFRTGLSMWTALDSQELFSGVMSFWAEVWAELAHETTAFAEDPAKDFYPLILDILAGPQFPLGKVALQPYYSFTLSRDFGSERWNKEPWLNNLTFGPGIRFSMGEMLPLAEADLYLYGEYLEVEYMDRVDEDLYAYSSDEDFRAGIEFYLPFGATSERIRRH